MNRIPFGPGPALVLALALPAQQLNYPLPPQHSGRLYLSEWNRDLLSEYRPDGTHLRDFTAPGMQAPRGVAVDELGRVVVVCERNARILIFELDGTLAQTVTHPDLTAGTGIGRAPSGEWYVGNFNPGRVLVFSAGWVWQRTITNAGMNGVNCVAFDPSGDFAVSAALANRVDRFDRNGAFVGSVTHPSMRSPMSIALDSRGDRYVSNGSSGVVIKFDPTWNPLLVFGTGVLSAPQGVLVDENDRLTISNFGSSTVHRFDSNGGLLGSFPLRAGTVARNLSFQTSAFVLARRGSVDAAAGLPVPVLSVRGHAADQLGRVRMLGTDPLRVDILASPAGPQPASYALLLSPGEPGLAQVWSLPSGAGLMAIPPVIALPSRTAPGLALDLPNGAGVLGVVALQAVMLDHGSRGVPAFPLSATNALVIGFR